jgi:very-short-patch-repair endonuclease
MEALAHLEPQITFKPEKLTISDYCRVKIRCSCGRIIDTSVRNLVRKWSDQPYRCKSCDVKTYARDPEKIRKCIESQKVGLTDERRKKLSESAKKLWLDPGLRAKVTEAVSEDNRTNPLKAKARKKAHQAWMEKYGKSKLIDMRLKQDGIVSIPECIVKSILEGYKIEFIHQYRLGYYTFDFFVPSKKLLIEVQGEYWHGDSQTKDSAKANYAVSLGYNVRHLWENEFNEFKKVDALISQWLDISPPEQKEFDFNDVTIRDIENKLARVFLGKYHYLPAISKSGFHLGAFLGDELIACVTFSYVTRLETAIRLKLNIHQIRELGRFCISPEYHKKNFSSWFLSRAVKTFHVLNPKVQKLISFADTSIHEGTIYKAANWVLDGETNYNYVYRSSDGYLIHKKTVWDRAKKLSLSESEYASSHGYIKVWSKPKRRFIFDLANHK